MSNLISEFSLQQLGISCPSHQPPTSIFTHKSFIHLPSLAMPPSFGGAGGGRVGGGLEGGFGTCLIGIYGGTFNPLHNGHVALAKAFLEQAQLDEVWFVVSPQNPFKVNDRLLDDNVRLEMVREALADEPRLKVCDIEFHLPKPSYTYQTLRSLSEKHPDYKFTLLIGGDNWAAFDRWRNPDEIVKNYNIAVYPRKGDNIDESTLPPSVSLLNTPLINISSTEVRQRVHDGLSINGLVPPKIADFIEKYNLYK